MGNRDDPMDLGPFMQNYVLNNPFSQLQLPAATSANEKTKSGEEEEHIRGNGPFVSDRAGIKKRHSSLKKTNVGFADVQEWLCSNYRFLPGYGASIRMRSLLQQAIAIFPQVTNFSLNRTMKTLFPDCHKMAHKLGAYYQGLVKRPNESDYADSGLLSAVDEVLSGRSNLGRAMASYAIEESRIIQMLVWEHNFLSISDDEDKSISGLQKELERLNSNPDYNSSEEEKSPMRGRRKSKRKRKRPSRDLDFEYTLDAIEGVHHDVGLEKKLKSEDSDEIVAICVKQEPGEMLSDEASQDSAFCSNKNSDNDDEKKKCDSQTMIGLLQQKLTQEKDTNDWLRSEMGAASEQTLALRSEIFRRDEQFSHLAEKFFALNRHFQQMSQRLRSFMKETACANHNLGLKSVINNESS